MKVWRALYLFGSTCCLWQAGPAAAEALNHVTIYLDRSGSMQPQSAEGVGHASPFKQAVTVIAGLASSPFLQGSETQVFMFDTNVDEVSSLRLPTRAARTPLADDITRELFVRRTPLAASGTDLVPVLEHIARQADVGQRQLFVIISDFIPESRSDGLSDTDRARQWDTRAAMALMELQRFFAIHQRANMFLLDASQPERSLALRSKVVESIRAATQRGRNESVGLSIATLNAELEMLTRPLQLTVTRIHGGFNVAAENVGSDPEQYLVTGLRFLADDDREVSFTAIPSALAVGPGETKKFNLDDQWLKFRGDGPIAGTVVALGRDSATKDETQRELSLPARFHRGNFLDLLEAQAAATDVRRLTLQIQAKGQTIDADTVKLVLSSEPGREIDFTRCARALSVSMPRQLSLTLDGPHALSSPDVRDVVLSVMAGDQKRELRLSRDRETHPERSEHDFAEHLVVPLLLAMPAIALVLLRRRAVNLRFFEEIVAVVTVVVSAQVAILQEATITWRQIEDWAAANSQFVAPGCVLVTGAVFALAAWKGLFDRHPSISTLRAEFLAGYSQVAERTRRRRRGGASAAVLAVTGFLIWQVWGAHLGVGACTFESAGFQSFPAEVVAKCP